MSIARGPASRAGYNPELLDVLRVSYGIESRPDTKDLGGSSNLNLLVADGSERYVVRVYRPWVTAARLEDIQLVRSTVNRGGVPCPLPIRTLEGRGWTQFEDRLIEVERYVKHDAKMDSWERIAIGLQSLGRIHTLLQPLRLSIDGRQAPAANSIDASEALAWTLRGTQRLHDWNPSPDELRLADAAEELAHLVVAAERAAGPLHPQIVHGDFWDNNVLFRSGRPGSVMDFDFMGERPRIDDLALSLYYTNSTFTDDQVSYQRIHQLQRLTTAYERGLSERLTDVERRSLPLALARTPLGFIDMIAMTDTEREGRSLAAEMMADISWALTIARSPDRWQEAFA